MRPSHVKGADRTVPSADTTADAPRSTLLSDAAVLTSDTAGAGAGRDTDRVPRAGLHDGAIVDRYVMLSHLGSGGMATVHAAWDQKLGRQVALKLLHSGPFATEKHALRLHREARALAKVNHDHVVRVFDVGEWEGRPFITMELVDGQDIDAYIEAHTPAPEAIVRLYIDAGRGLAAAHALGVIHRDVKGDNIFVGADGRARIGDFGIATMAGETGDSASLMERPTGHDEMSLRNRVTAAGVVLGTPGFMAPEQVEGSAVDARCDQFSFCVALWQAVFGQDPFPANDSILARFERMQQAPATPKRRWPALEQALARGLRFEAKDRHADMATLLVALDDVLMRPRRLAMAAGAAVIMAALGLSGIAAARHDPCDLRAAGAAVRGPPLSSSASPLLEAALTPWLARWTASAVAVCREDGLEEEVRAARLRCFEARRKDAIALVGLVVEGRVSDDAGVQAALALAPPSSCLDDRQVSPADPEGTAALAAARMALLTGEPATAESGGMAALARARGLGHDALVADAALVVGQAAMHRGGLAEAEAALREGIAAAMTAGAARTEAMLWTSLVDLLGDKFKRREEARALLPWMEAAVRRFPGDVDLQGEGLIVRALMANEAEDRRTAAALATEAFVLALQRDPVSPHAVARATNLRTLWLAASGEQAQAISALREGVEIMRRSLPEHHIRFLALHNSLGLALRRAGDIEGARRAFTEAVAIVEHQHRPADHEALHGVPLMNLAALELVAGDTARARERATRAHALLVGSIGSASDRVSYADERLALVAAAEQRFTDARRHANDMIARHATREAGGFLHGRGVVLAAAIDVEAAAAPKARGAGIAAARARLDAFTTTNNGARASVGLARAALALAAGDRAEARLLLAAAEASDLAQTGSAEERDLHVGLRSVLDDGSVVLLPPYVPLGRIVREAAETPRRDRRRRR